MRGKSRRGRRRGGSLKGAPWGSGEGEVVGRRGTVRPLCFIFLESSLKTADTWYRIPPHSGRRRRRRRAGFAREHHTVCDKHTHIHTQGEYYRRVHTLGRGRECVN